MKIPFSEYMIAWRTTHAGCNILWESYKEAFLERKLNNEFYDGATKITPRLILIGEFKRGLKEFKGY